MLVLRPIFLNEVLDFTFCLPSFVPHPIKLMPGYQTKYETVTVGGSDYLIRSLFNNQQYADPQGEAELAGISPASWPLFGLVWPSARVLALLMHHFDLRNKRILEVGAGLALASLVIHRRAGNITVSDWHPLSSAFLARNLLLNQLSPLSHQRGNWAGSNPELGQFDLIIGSDVLYERQQAKQLAHFLHTHAATGAQVIIVDPNRGNRANFCHEMAQLGYQCQMLQANKNLEDGQPYQGRLLYFQRH